jgi:hypothetical protein
VPCGLTLVLTMKRVITESNDTASQLTLSHPLFFVPPQVERFIFRPGLQDRARYYAVIFLNQLPLSHKVNLSATSPAAGYPLCICSSPEHAADGRLPPRTMVW